MNAIEAIKGSLFWRVLGLFQKAILILSSLFVALIMCAQVLMRYVFKSDLYGMEEIIVIVAFWLYFMGSSYGVYEKSHVRADIIPQLLSEKPRRILSLAVQATMTALCLLFSWWGLDFIGYSLQEMPRTLIWAIPLAVGQSSVLAGYLIMSFYSVVYLAEEFLEIRAFLRKDSTAEATQAR
ncbi:TRAP transporter small permease [Aminithiophilus ramosus]|uniref:TRAP transporter small permease n=2 Tax=Synergistales TaxID=649776 RepID=A0A9Q7A7R7_9BACT|nr:TRAP transporter small permease [Aminithiophilus ramosus]QTX32266.1 TRAP transporter small permease [Aminithiophilus ramosus]QVL36133.1 TRAP transporter small permease [Synergistota bacterium]